MLLYSLSSLLDSNIIKFFILIICIIFPSLTMPLLLFFNWFFYKNDCQNVRQTTKDKYSMNVYFVVILAHSPLRYILFVKLYVHVGFITSYIWYLCSALKPCTLFLLCISYGTYRRYRLRGKLYNSWPESRERSIEVFTFIVPKSHYGTKERPVERTPGVWSSSADIHSAVHADLTSRRDGDRRWHCAAPPANANGKTVLPAFPRFLPTQRVTTPLQRQPNAPILTSAVLTASKLRLCCIIITISQPPPLITKFQVSFIQMKHFNSSLVI